MVTKTKDWIVENRVYLISVTASLLTFVIIYLYRIGSFVRGDSLYESTTYLGIEQAKNILENISLAPIKTLEYIMVAIDEPNATLLRLVSLFIVVVSIGTFYALVSKWYTSRIALLATLLFATSSYSLHLGRFSTQDALYYLVFPSLLLFGVWLKSKKFVVRLPYILPVLALFLYLPGFVYIIAILAIVFRKRLLLAWRFVDIRKNIIFVAVSFFLIVPLIYSLILYPAQIIKYLGIDRLLGANGIKETFLELNSIPNYLFFNGPTDHYRWLVGTPILDIASAALLVLGIYGFIRGPHTLRARTLFILGIVTVVLIGTGTIVTTTLLIPLIYIVIANGIVYLMESWFTVFPRNPAARNTALALLAIFLLLICSYQLQRYFIAWPNSPETKAALSVKAE